MKCPKCGTENNGTAKFCKICGEKLGPGSSQDTSSKVKSSSVNSASEPKDNKKLLMISVTAIVCLIIIAGALFALNSSDNSGISSNANSAIGVDSSDSSSGYYPYDFCGYTFNIPEGWEEFSIDEYSTEVAGGEQIGFKKDDSHYMFIGVKKDVQGLTKESLDEMYNDKTIDGVHFTYQEFGGKKVYRFTNGTIDWVFLGSGNDLISVLTCNEDLEPIISSIDQKEIPSSSSSDSMTYSEASSYLSGASNTVIQNTFDEADADGDGLLTGSEITKFKKLADLTERTADTSNTENVEAQDYGAGDGTTKTRYCTTHGRVAVGSDNLCPYCQEEGLDARTVKGSTEYI